MTQARCSIAFLLAWATIATWSIGSTAIASGGVATWSTIAGPGCDPAQPAPFSPTPTISWSDTKGARCYRLRGEVPGVAILESRAYCSWIDPDTGEWHQPGVTSSVSIQAAFPEVAAGTQLRVRVVAFNEIGEGPLSETTIELCVPLAFEPLD